MKCPVALISSHSFGIVFSYLIGRENLAQPRDLQCLASAVSIMAKSFGSSFENFATTPVIVIDPLYAFGFACTSLTDNIPLLTVVLGLPLVKPLAAVPVIKVIIAKISMVFFVKVS